MIPFNLKKDDGDKNHPMDNRYGVITGNNLYSNYPVTIVDNHEEVVDGKYTRKPALCLIHLSEDVRQYMSLRLFDEFLYLSFHYQTPTYRMFDYKLVELTKEEIISTLKNVLYQLQPSLQTRSCIGTTSKRLEDDPNYYEGTFVLNDEEQYTILKCKKQYKLFKGTKHFYPDWEKEKDLLYSGEINFAVYAIALEVNRLRRIIVTDTNKFLDEEDIHLITDYKELKKELEAKIVTENL